MEGSTGGTGVVRPVVVNVVAAVVPMVV